MFLKSFIVEPPFLIALIKIFFEFLIIFLQCVVSKFCYDGKCADAAKSTTSGTTTPCTESDTNKIAADCQCASSSSTSVREFW